MVHCSRMELIQIVSRIQNVPCNSCTFINYCKIWLSQISVNKKYEIWSWMKKYDHFIKSLKLLLNVLYNASLLAIPICHSKSWILMAVSRSTTGLISAKLAPTKNKENLMSKCRIEIRIRTLRFDFEFSLYRGLEAVWEPLWDVTS